MATSVIQSWLTYAKLLFEQLPFPFSSEPLHSAIGRLYDFTLGNVRKTPVFLIRGRVKNASCPLTAAFVGSEESANHFARVAYSSVECIRSLGKMLCHHDGPLRLPEAEIIVEHSAWYSSSRARKSAEKQSCFVLPIVDFSLSLNQSLATIVRKASRRRRRDLRKLKALDYSYTVCRNCPEDFDLFYRTMYLPFTEQRYKRAALFISYIESKARFQRNGGILFVEEEGMRTAGILFQIRGKTMYALSLGICSGNNGFQKSLAGTAALYYLILWAKKNGLATLNYGPTLPFFSDGVFVYKKEWGMSISTRAHYGFWTLKINTLSKGTIFFLKKNPFIMSEKGKMRAVVLLGDESTKIDPRRLASEFTLPQLDSPVVLAYSTRSMNTEGLEGFQELTHVSTENLTKPLSDFCQLLLKPDSHVRILDYKQ
jgi:hypothetical protein